mmetsp:Transcript_104097/g.333757  ORF Transcript_104097/g.333757 Transcript_104097/m.333757 type:complete len:219 (+) Transcript_104097:96-752(+)
MPLPASSSPPKFSGLGGLDDLLSFATVVLGEDGSSLLESAPEPPSSAPNSARGGGLFGPSAAGLSPVPAASRAGGSSTPGSTWSGVPTPSRTQARRTPLSARTTQLKQQLPPQRSKQPGRQPLPPRRGQASLTQRSTIRDVLPLDAYLDESPPRSPLRDHGAAHQALPRGRGNDHAALVATEPLSLTYDGDGAGLVPPPAFTLAHPGARTDAVSSAVM